MPKKACCCKSCCPSYNYTNNVAMLGDLLVEKEFVLDENGDLIIDPNNPDGGYLTEKKVQVYPINPDDELILFQLPGPANIYGGPAVYQTVRDHGCACCYGRTIQRPLRTEPVRQKYKNIGCSWTWYPPKFAINGDPNIPQCSLFSEGFEYSNCYFNFTDPQLNMGASETPDMLPRKCQSCTQVHPWVADAHDIDFDIWGDPQSPLIQVPGGPTDEGITNRAQFSEYGWMTQFTTPFYPSHNIADMTACCTCNLDPLSIQGVLLADATSSCWNSVANGNESATTCYANAEHRELLNYHPLRSPQNSAGNAFYSPLMGRTPSIKNPATLGTADTFMMGVNIPEFGGTGFFVNEELVDSLYTPSKGGFNQNRCTFCGMSPYLRRMMLANYPWAFDIFCAGGGGINDPVKTFDIGPMYVTYNLTDHGLYQSDEVRREVLGLVPPDNGSDGQDEFFTFKMEQVKPMLGESTFFSQFIGTVHLEHYFHYMGVNMEDVNAAGDTIPPNPLGSGSGQSPKDRWGYWNQRTTPKMFVYQSSGTPLFHFDLVYADLLGIFSAFRDPDPSNVHDDGNGNQIPGTMTIDKFISYFTMFSNSVRDNGLTDGRGKGMFPCGCSDAGHKYVQIVKDILDAMCQAGIIGTRDHREVIYKEIKQIIETGIANGRNGAYYKPWELGNPIPVTPKDFDALYAKYYTPYGRLCTEKEMFPESGINGLEKLSPIRKVIPPSFLHYDKWKGDGIGVPAGGLMIYQEHKLNPDDIFKEQDSNMYNCITGDYTSQGFSSSYKIQDLQYSKYYNGGHYDKNAPGYVNRQLFFRAIPGTWKLVKWGSIVQNIRFNSYCNGPTPCSPYNIWGYGTYTTFNPENLWHDPSLLSTYQKSDSYFYNGYLALCSGIDPEDKTWKDIEHACNDEIHGQGGVAEGSDAACGYGGLCWDPSGAPSQTSCTVDCSLPDAHNSICETTTTCCGKFCGARCGPSVSRLLGSGSTGNDDRLCKDMFGITCCSCIGKSPDDYISYAEWEDIIFGNQQKCSQCATECLVSCPDNPAPRFTNTSRVPVKPVRGSEGTGGSVPSDPCSACNCATYSTSCPVLGTSPCDTNCGYNGFSYHSLAVVCSTSQYDWGIQRRYQNVECTLCQCGSRNYCYARFGGKVQAFLENTDTHFYSPQYDTNGNLFYTQNFINVNSPYHLLKPGSMMAKQFDILSNCEGECAPDPAADPASWCMCQGDFNVGQRLCPGAVYAAYHKKSGVNGGCDQNVWWCKLINSGRIKLYPIVNSDVNPTLYQY